MPELQSKLDQNYLYKHMHFAIKMTFSSLKDPPYGRAYRLGVPELQTKFDRNCLYKNMHFIMKTSFLLIKTIENLF